MSEISAPSPDASEPTAFDVRLSLNETEFNALKWHTILGTKEGAAYAPVVSQLYGKGLLASDMPAQGYQSEPIALTALGEEIVEAMGPLTPLENCIQTSRRLESHVQKMKQDMSALWTLVESDIEASAYSVAYRYGKDAKPNASKAELEKMAFEEVTRDLCRLAATRAGSSARPANWDDIDELAASISSRAALHMLADGCDLLRGKIRDAVAHGMDEKGGDIG